MSLGMEYKSVDWDASPHAGAPDLVADLNQPLPIADRTADYIFCWSVLEHLKNPAQFLAEACRVTRAGGKLVLQVPFMWQVHEAPHDYYRFTPFGLTYLLSNAGFRDIVIVAQSGVATTLVMKSLYQLRRVTQFPVLRLICHSFYFVTIPLYIVAASLDILTKSAGETSGFIVTARRDD